MYLGKRNRFNFKINWLVIFLILFFLNPVQAKIENEIFLWGSQGEEVGQFQQPRQIKIAYRNYLYVADFRNNRIQIFNLEGKIVKAIGELGNGPLQFKDPSGLDVDEEGNIYVADTWNHRIQVISPQFKFIREYKANLFAPKAVRCLPDKSLAISDTGNGRIVLLDKEGQIIRSFGEKGEKAGQFIEPIGIDLLDEASLVIADTGNYRIQILSLKGEVKAHWQIAENKNGFKEAFLSVDKNRRIFVADPLNSRIRVFNEQGNLLGEWGQNGTEPGKFQSPAAIAIGPDGSVYVSDTWNFRIQRFSANFVAEILGSPVKTTEPQRLRGKILYFALILTLLILAGISFFLRKKLTNFLRKFYTSQKQKYDFMEEKPEQKAIEMEKTAAQEFGETFLEKGIFKDRWFSLIYIFIFLFLASYGQYLLTQKISISGAIFLCVLSSLLVFWFAWNLRGIEIGFKERGKLPLWSAVAVFLIIAIVAGFFRIYKLNSIPPGLNNDEAFNGIEALSILKGWKYEPISDKKWQQETLYFYIMSVFVYLLGPVEVPLRLTSAVLGFFSVFFIYFLLKDMFNRRTAIAGSLGLAIFLPHIVYSRMALREILQTFIQIPMFLYLHRSITRMRITDFFLCGIFSGLIFHTYSSARITPFFLITVFLYAIFTVKGFFKRFIKFLPVYLAGVILPLIPMIDYAMKNWHAFKGRTSGHLWIGNVIKASQSLEPLINNLKVLLSTFTYSVGGGSSYDPDKGMLGFIMSILFLPGIIFAVANLRIPAFFILIAGMFWYVLPPVLSEPFMHRFVGVFPLVPIFPIVFLIFLLEYINTKFKPRWGIIYFSILFFVFAFSIYESYKTYFYDFRQNHTFDWGYFPNITEAARRVRELSKDYDIAMSRNFAEHDTMKYLNFYTSNYHKYCFANFNYIPFKIFDMSRDVIFHPQKGKGVAFFLDPFHHEIEDIKSILSHFYKDFKVERVDNPNIPNQVMFWQFTIPQKEIEAIQGWEKTISLIGYSAGNLEQLETVMEKKIEKSDRFFPNNRLAKKITWKSNLIIPEMDYYKFIITGIIKASFIIDDKEIKSSSETDQGSEYNLPLSKGVHSIEITVQNSPQPDPITLSWISPKNRKLDVLPEEYLSIKDARGTYLQSYNMIPTNLKYTEVFKAAGHGEDPKSLRDPYDIVADKEGFIYVADSWRGRIKKYDGSGNFITAWGRKGDDDQGMKERVHLAIHPSGDIYLSDELNRKITRFSPEGKFKGVIIHWPNVIFPKDLVFDSQGNLFVADFIAKGIVKMDSSGKIKMLSKIEGSSAEFLRKPVSVAVDSDDNLYIADFGLNCILKLNKEGEFVKEWFPKYISEETHLTCSSENLIFMTAPEKQTIYIFDREGNLLYSPSANRLPGLFPPSEMLFPRGITTDEQGNVFICDGYQDWIFKFAPHHNFSNLLTLPEQ